MDQFLNLKNRHTGETLRLRRVRDTSGEIILEIEGTLPARSSGPPLHAHFHQREEGVVKAGTLGVQVGKEKTVIPTGGAAVFVPGIVHNWWNAGDDLLEFIGRSVPAVDLDRYLQAVFAVLNAGTDGKPPIYYLAHVMWRHRRTQSIAIPPRPVQSIVFPLIILMGRILGKYRGTDWPGSPESCMGAPMVEGT